MPGADDLLTAVERRTSHLVARRQEDDAGTWNDGRAYHFDGAALVSANDAVFQLQVVVVAFKLHESLLAVLPYELGSPGISFQCDFVAAGGENLLCLLHIFF